MGDARLADSCLSERAEAEHADGGGLFTVGNTRLALALVLLKRNALVAGALTGSATLSKQGRRRTPTHN